MVIHAKIFWEFFDFYIGVPPFLKKFFQNFSSKLLGTPCFQKIFFVPLLYLLIKTPMKKLIFASLTLMMLTSFSFKPKSQHIVLVLKSTLETEAFSVFNITQVNGVLIGSNTEDYPVADGLYRIEGSSNDKFYHKHIMITSN